MIYMRFIFSKVTKAISAFIKLFYLKIVYLFNCVASYGGAFFCSPSSFPCSANIGVVFSIFFSFFSSFFLVLNIVKIMPSVSRFFIPFFKVSINFKNKLRIRFFILLAIVYSAFSAAAANISFGQMPVFAWLASKKSFKPRFGGVFSAYDFSKYHDMLYIIFNKVIPV